MPRQGRAIVVFCGSADSVDEWPYGPYLKYGELAPHSLCYSYIYRVVPL